MRPWLKGGGVRRSPPLCGDTRETGKPRRSTFGWSSWVVEVRGFEPLASSVRVSGGPPLCGPAFPQVDWDRQGRSKAF